MNDTIRTLLAAASETAARREARAAWVKATAAQWRAAQRAMDERLDEAVDRLFSAPGFPGEGDQNGGGAEAEFERLFDEEEAKVDAFRKPLKDAAERDVWPRELYWGCV